VISRIFIDRPIFAWVIAIIIMLLGLAAIYTLPVAQYPDVAPTTVNVRASYPGASAETLEASVTQIIEQQLTGIDGLLYFQATSNSRGGVNITATFQKGVNPDIAQVQVQNKVQQALPRLPQQVQQQGLVVSKSNPDFLLIVAIYDATDRVTNQDVSDYLTANLADEIGRLPGVGDTNVFGAQYAMRIWLNPARLAAFQLIPQDVISAVQAQNAEVPAGEIGGQPMPPEQMLSAIVTSQSRLQTPEQFREIILKSRPDGSTVTLGDVARVELGSENYTMVSRVKGHPGSGIAIMLAPGADALTTAQQVKDLVLKAAPNFPPGYKYGFLQDTTRFIKVSIEEVVWTIAEAIALVILVMFVFLQSWRATLVPAIAIPVVMLGTFAVFAVAGFSINTLTLFGLVLAIGLLVDDAIVVVENVERLMEEDPKLTPRDASIKSMGEIQGALIAIALVLCAVFLPMAFFGGSTGVIYKQFSITIVSAMVLSVIVANVLSPALTATVLKRKEDLKPGWIGRRFPAVPVALAGARDKFNTGFHAFVQRYLRAIHYVVDRKMLFLGLYAVVVALMLFMFAQLSTGFLPNEDQGGAQLQFRLPGGATQARTLAVQKAIENYVLTKEKKDVDLLFTVSGGGGGGGGGGQNAGQGFINFTEWKDRKGAENTADSIIARATRAFQGFRDAQVFVLVPPAVRGLGQANGFNLQLQNVGGMTRAEFQAARDRLIRMAADDPVLASVRAADLPDSPSLKVDLDEQKLNVLGLSATDVNSTLSTAWGGRYVNDFVDRGRVKRVYVQGDAPFRNAPEDLSQWYVRTRTGEMAPFSAFAQSNWTMAPATLSRFSGVPAYEIQGQAAPGHSSGDAMNRMEALAGQIPGVSVAWSGLSYQERLATGQGPILYGISLLVVFLCLAALYESWSIPVAVMLIIPIGLAGAVFGVTLRGLQNDVFLQIGLLTTMGLAAKNAILMIEFAEQAERQGKRVIDSAIEAARIRIRPILMTSFAFIFGVMPLALASGAGANGRIAIGTSVIGGMLTATILAIFYIPLFFVLVRRSTRGMLVKVFHYVRPSRPPEPPFVGGGA